MLRHRERRCVWLLVALCGVLSPATARGKAPIEPQARPDDDSAHAYLTANGLLNRGLYDLATGEYRRFLNRHAESEQAPAARYGLAVCLFRTEQFEDAATELEKLADLDGFAYAAEVGAMLGRCCLTRGDYAEAQAVLDRVVEQHRRHDLADDAAAGAVEARYLLAHHDQVIARAKKFSKRWPGSPLLVQVTFHRACSEMELAEYAAAAGRFKALGDDESNPALARRAEVLYAQCLEQLNRSDEAAAGYERVLGRKQSPYEADALAGLARVRHAQGKLDDAARLLDRLLERHAESPQAAAAALQRGQIWLEQGRPERAATMFAAAKKAGYGPPDEIAYWQAKCKLRQGAADEAADDLAALIRQHGDSRFAAEASYDRAVALLRSGANDQARTTLAGFLERFGDHALAAEARYLLAVLTHREGDYDESRRQCREFLRRYADHAQTAEIEFLAAENAFLADRLDGAVEGFRAFVQRHPDHERTMLAAFRLGMAAYRLERPDEAVRWLRRLPLDGEIQLTFAPALLALGEIHFQRGEWEQAVAWLTRYLAQPRAETQTASALFKLGFAQQQQGEPTQALESYDRVLLLEYDHPFRGRAEFERGRLLAGLNRADEAAQAFEAAVAGDEEPELAGYAQYELGALASRAGDHAAAGAHFRLAARHLPEPELQAEAAFQHGQSLLAAGRHADAEKAFTGFLRRFAEHHRAAQARANLATALARQDRSAAAVAAIEDIEREAASGLNPAVRANLRYEKAWSLQQQGDTDAAATAYRQVLGDAAAGPDLQAHAALALAEIHAEQGRHEAVVEVLAPILKAREADAYQLPRDLRGRALFRLGLGQFETGEFAAAAATLEQFLTDFGSGTLAATAGLYCGEAFYAAGRYERAVERLDTVVRDFPDSDAGGPALLRLGEALAALQRWARSERVLTEYLERLPNSAQDYQARFGLGWARENQGRYSEAVAAYRQVTQRHQGPTAARAQFQIGECLFALEQHQEAVKELLKVDILYAYPQWSAAALYEAGRCFEKLRQTAEARKQYEAVQQRYPEAKWSSLAADRLTTLADSPLPGR